MGNLVPFERLLREAQQDPAKLYVLYMVAAGLGILALAALALFHKYFRFVLKSMFRNVARTLLASGAIFLLVLVLIPILSVVVFLELALTEQSKNLKAVVSERYQIPSQMPFAYAATLEAGAPRPDHPEDVRVAKEDSMTWQFVGGTLDPTKNTRENMIFLFAMDPTKLTTMMDDLEKLDPKLVQGMIQDKKGVLLGKERLKMLNKQVGDKFEMTSMNYKGIKFEFDIVGRLPDGRYDLSAVMNRDYLNDMLDKYARENNGQKHPLANKSLNLVWVRVPDSEAFQQVSGQIMNSPLYTVPSVKCETASSGIATFLDAYKSLFWGVKFLLMPSILIIMSLVIACAISISVRERRTEIAVLKVLGYSPRRILAFVLGEALLIGSLAGLAAAASVYVPVHFIMHGFAFPIAFFPIFDIFSDALWWGLAIGLLTSFVGSFIPALMACTVNVSNVFAKVG